MVMFHDVSTSAIPQEGQIPLIPPPTPPPPVALSPRGLVAQDQVRILHGDEDGLVVLPQGIWLIWTYLDMYQTIYIKMICGYLWISVLCLFCGFQSLLYHAIPILATCPNIPNLAILRLSFQTAPL